MQVELIARRWEKPVEGPEKRSKYTAGWTKIVRTFRTEVAHLGATSVVVEMDLQPSHIRTSDQWIYSYARPGRPGVRATFTGTHGTLAYECATWNTHEHNLWAIARTLSAQRAMARDGAVRGDQVYRGFKALQPAPAAEFATVEAARNFLIVVAGVSGTDGEVYRAAAKKAHPDHGGTEKMMAKVNRARAFIEAHA